MRIALVLLLALSAPAGFARADAVVVGPMECPPGAMISASHEGTRCAPTTCQDDATCARIASGGAGRPGDRAYACRPSIGVCVETRILDDPRGRRADGSPVQLEREVAVAACGEDGSCPTGSTCETARRCVQPEPERSLCSVAPIPGSSAPWIVVGLALLAWRRVRRRTCDRRLIITTDTSTTGSAPP